MRKSLYTRDESHERYNAPYHLKVAFMSNIEHPMDRAQKERSLETPNPSKYDKNPDIPYTEAFVAQGTKHKSPYTDPEVCKMNAVDFRERCIQAGNRLIAMHTKTIADMQGPWHLRPATVQKWLECEYVDAETIAAAFKALSFDRKTVIKVLSGICDKGTPAPAAARWFENLASELDDPIDRPEAEREFYHELVMETGHISNPLAQMEYIEVMASMDIHLNFTPEVTDPNIYMTEEVMAAREAELFDQTDPDYLEDPVPSEYSGHTLFDGTEACSHEFLTMIRNADYATLRALKKKVGFYTITRPDGKKIRLPAEYRKAMTSTQCNQTWRYIRDREAELAAQVTVTPEVANTLSVIERNGVNGYTRAYALSHINGEHFRDGCITIRFNQPSEGERMLIMQRLYS